MANNNINAQQKSINILLNLRKRANDNYNGTLNFFLKAGIVPEKVDKITLADLKQLQKYQTDVFNELLQFLYPEKYNVANADGFDWQTMVGGILAGTGSAFMSMGDTAKTATEREYELEMARLEAAKEAEKSEQSNNSWVKYALIGGGVLVLVIVVAVLLKRH